MYLLNVKQTLSSWRGETSDGKRVDIIYLRTDRDKLKVAIDGIQQTIPLQDEYAGVFCTADLIACGFKVQSWQKAVMA